MASFATRNYSTLLARFVAQVQASSSTLLDFSVGSVLRAIGQANSAVVLWLQGAVLTLLKTTRLATSFGSDVDSFVNDFALDRNNAVQAKGAAVFSRVTPSIASLVPVGAAVLTSDGKQPFAVIADTTNPNYSTTLGGYPIGIGTLSVSATVQAINPGAQGNVVAGSIAVMQTGISGVDSVTNPANCTGGIDEETDAALKARFRAYIGSLSEGTEDAITAAINGLEQGLQVRIASNQDLDGTPDNGMVTIIVDDGTGSISGALVTLANATVLKVRAAGVRTGVYAATKVNADVTMTLTVAAGYVGATVIAQVVAAITAYINALGLGNSLPFTRLAEVAYDASPGVINVTNISLNAATVDLAATFKQTIKAHTIAVS